MLLKRRLKKAEVDAWLAFRAKFLAYKRAEVGDLVCHYCGRKNLVEEMPMDAPKAQLVGLATIDHVKPRSKGGNDEYSNLVVACFPCNQRKADNELDSVLV